MHVFGHTHINHDKILNGVRYVQHPLKYPDERQVRRHSSLATRFIVVTSSHVWLLWLGDAFG